MTYYGRWTYKYEMGAQKGAAGVLIVHETAAAATASTSCREKTGEQFDLVTPDKNMGRAAIEGWITLESAKTLLKNAGQDSMRSRRRRRRATSSPCRCGITASMTIANKLRTINSRNVLAKLEGSDPALKDQ